MLSGQAWLDSGERGVEAGGCQVESGTGQSAVLLAGCRSRRKAGQRCRWFERIEKNGLK